MRIIISFLVLLTLPFILIESKGKSKDLKKQPKVYYYNADYNYSIKYPNAFTPIFDKKKHLLLQDTASDAQIEIKAKYGVSNKDIYELNDLYLAPGVKEDSTFTVAYHIINGSIGEISYASAEEHFFEKIHHLGNRIIQLKISAPIDRAAYIDEVRTSLEMEVNADVTF